MTGFDINLFRMLFQLLFHLLKYDFLCSLIFENRQSGCELRLSESQTYKVEFDKRTTFSVKPCIVILNGMFGFRFAF